MTQYTVPTFGNMASELDTPIFESPAAIMFQILIDNNTHNEWDELKMKENTDL